MKNLKTILAASTAMALATAAWADSNESYVDQVGDDNNALVEQTGMDNVAGRNGQPMLQSGDNNDLDVEQTGDENLVGSNGNPSPNGHAEQLGDDNVAEITQTSNGNRVVRLRQTGDTGTGTTENSLSLVQDGEDNSALTIIQSSTAAGSDVGNSAVLSQEGSSNLINSANQVGDANDMTVSMTGDANGTTSLTGVADVANDAKFVQRGLGNFVGVDIDANNTGIGVEQRGDGNSVGTLTITGDWNQVGIAQGGEINQSSNFGDNNTVALGVIEGYANIIGISQFNDDNMATVNVIGDSDDNVVSILQRDAFGTGGEAIVNIEGEHSGGDMNSVIIEQQAWGFAEVGIDGDWNDVSVTQFNADKATVVIDGAVGEGDDNALSIVQGLSGTANPNTMTVEIYGDDNNTSGGFSGDALGVASAATGYQTWNGLQPGELSQKGQGNSMDLMIGEYGVAESNDNLFAASQDGNANVLSGTINGNMNQAVVAQLGNANVANFTQIGNGNNLGVMQ